MAATHEGKDTLDKDPYEVLGLRKTAGESEIRRKFQVLAKQVGNYHDAGILLLKI